MRLRKSRPGSAAPWSHGDKLTLLRPPSGWAVTQAPPLPCLSGGPCDSSPPHPTPPPTTNDKRAEVAPGAGLSDDLGDVPTCLVTGPLWRRTQAVRHRGGYPSVAAPLRWCSCWSGCVLRQGLPVPAPPPPHTHPDVLTLAAHAESEYALGGLALIKGQGRAALAPKGTWRSRPKAAQPRVGPLVETSLPSLSALARNLSNSL